MKAKFLLWAALVFMATTYLSACSDDDTVVPEIEQPQNPDEKPDKDPEGDPEKPDPEKPDPEKPDPEKPDEVVSIGDVLAAPAGSVCRTRGQVVAVNARSFLLEDATGRILVYLGWDTDTNMPAVAYQAAVGQHLRVKGTTEEHGSLVQFGDQGLSIVLEQEGSYTHPEPAKYDGAAFDAYKTASENARPGVEYIEYEGRLSISGYYHNVAVDGTKLEASIQYPAEGFVDKTWDGRNIVVRAYTLGMTNKGRNVATIAVSVELGAQDPTPEMPSVETIDQVIKHEVGGYYSAEGTIVATNARSFLMADASGIMLVYQGWDKEANAPKVPYDAAVGHKVRVMGYTKEFGGLVQFADNGLFIKKIGEEYYEQPGAELWTGKDFDSYYIATGDQSTRIKMVRYDGVLAINKPHYNIKVEDTDFQGSLAYVKDGAVAPELDGKKVTVRGYTLGMTNKDTMLSTMLVSIEEYRDEAASAHFSPETHHTEFSAAGGKNRIFLTTEHLTAENSFRVTVNNPQFEAWEQNEILFVKALENTTPEVINGEVAVELLRGDKVVQTERIAVKQEAMASSGAYFELTDERLRFSVQGENQYVGITKYNTTNATMEISCDNPAFSVKFTDNPERQELDLIVGIGENPTMQVVSGELTLVMRQGGAELMRKTIALEQDASKSDKVYAVGDIYEENGEKLGVVISVTPSGRHGVIISMDQSQKKWSLLNVMVSSLNVDGAVNTERIMAEENWQTNYPAFAWCVSRGEGWYFPSLNEMQKLVIAYNGGQDEWPDFEAREAFNRKLTTPLDDGAYYSTSTENTEDLCVIIPMNLSTADCTYPPYKSNEYRVRAARKF